MKTQNKRLNISKKLGIVGIASLALAGVVATLGAKEAKGALAAEIPNDRINLTVGSALSTYKGYQRYEGYVFALDEEKEITTTSSDALVLRFKNNKTSKCGYAFYLNGTLNSGTSGTPTTTYLYSDAGKSIQTISHGSFSVGYYVPAAGSTNYSYVSIPLSNFTNAVSGKTVALKNFTIAIRLQGVASTLDNSTSNASLYGAYLARDFATTGDLNVAGLAQIYTPKATNFTEFDSGNTGITSSCIVATFHKGETDAAVNYAKEFVSTIGAVCDEGGSTVVADLQSAWGTMATSYASLDADSKLSLKKSVETSKDDDLKAFASLYDYVYSKYTSDVGEDFAGRNPTPVSSAKVAILNNINNATLIVIISVVSVVSITALSVFFLKRKRQINK